MRTILYTIISITLAFTASAQQPASGLLKQANAEFAELRYAYAIPLYKRHIELNPKDANATLQLAKCYQINNQYDSAIKYTQVAVQLGANAGKLLPELFANKGDYASAVKAYTSMNSTLATARVKGFSTIKEFSDIEYDYALHNLAINTAFNEYAATPYKDGIVFESNRAEKIKGNNEFGWDGSAYSKLYYTTNKATTTDEAATKLVWSEKTFALAVSELSKETSNDVNTIVSKKFDFKNLAFQNNGVSYLDETLNSEYNVGSISFSADSTTAYFTRNQTPTNNLFKSSENEKHLLEIWSANVVNGKLENYSKLAFNQATASYFHPVLSKNGKRLYFISDQEGGKGGTDLYYADKDAQGNWGSAINAGGKVNTEANELFPTIAEGELYISSNGHAGLGGLDIYKVLFQNESIVGVENLGTPVNSTTDDMSFTKNGNKGYLVSNRLGSDDIYSFDVSLRKIKISGNVSTSEGAKSGLTVKLYTETPRTLIETATTDASGAYSFIVFPKKTYYIEASDANGNKAGLAANAKGYIIEGSGYSKKLEDFIINVPPPPPPVQDTKVTIKTIIDSLKGLTNDYTVYHHDFDKVSLVKSEWKSYNKLLANVRKLKKAKIVIVSAADCFGEEAYNEQLSAKRVNAIGYQILKVNRRNSIVKMHVGEKILQVPCDQNSTENGQIENRYTYVFILK